MPNDVPLGPQAVTVTTANGSGTMIFYGTGFGIAGVNPTPTGADGQRLGDWTVMPAATRDIEGNALGWLP